MAIQASTSGSDGAPELNTVFIDTSLGTNLITVVSSDETFSDLKKKVVHEHALCYPRFGEIKIMGFKVERNGKVYRFLESMLVKNAFRGVTEGWFVVVDAYAYAYAYAYADGDRSRNFVNPCSSNLPHGNKKYRGGKRKHAEVRCGSQQETDVLFDQSLKDDPKSEPSVKRRRAQEKERAEDLLNDDRKLVSESNKLMLENSTISQKSPVHQHHTRNTTLDGSASETIHLQSVGPSNKKMKRKKKSAKTSNQEAVVVHSGMPSSEPDAPCPKDNPAQEINLRPSSLEIGTRNKEAGNVEGGQNDVAEKHRNHVSGQDDGVDEGEFSPEVPPKTVSSEKHEISAQDDLQSKAKEGIMDSKFLEANEAVDPPKLSKKKKKSKKTKDLASVTPPTSATEHVNDLISSISPTKPQKIDNRDLHLSDISTSFLATDKEINDVIQNVVESHLMGKDEVGSESMLADSRKIPCKKQNSDAKQVTLANTGSTLLECDKDTTAENDRVQSAEVAQKLESNSKKRCPEAVISASPSRSGRVNEVTDNVDVSCQNSPINFNDYFAPNKQDLETVGSSQMLVVVDEATKTDGANGTAEAKKGKKKKKKHAAPSDGPSSDLKTPLMLGAKPDTGNSSPAEVQVSFTKANSEKITLQPNKQHSGISDRQAKSPVSSKSHKVNSVLEETPRSNDAKPAETVNGSNSNKAESNLESSKNIHSKRTRVNEHQSLEDHNHKVGRKASLFMNGEVVNSSKKGRSLVGALGSIFKDDGNDASSNVDGNSDASTRTPSDASLSSDYSDGESNDSSQNGSSNSKRDEVSRRAKITAIASGMTLDKILRSSSTFKKAKLTASQLQLEDPESLFIPDNLAQK